MISQNSRAKANLAMLVFAAKKLGKLKDEFVFLGGCSTALFITDPVAPDVRATLDVDCVVDVISLGHYYKIEKWLAERGFKKSMDDDVICRWRYDALILDVMPTDENIIGFGNRWYKSEVAHSITHEIAENLFVKAVTAPYFLATKFEAFKTRGNHDFLASHDFEDIIAVIDGRIELFDEIKNADLVLRQYLAGSFSNILNSDEFYLALPGHLNYGFLTDDREQMVLDRIEKIVALNGK